MPYKEKTCEQCQQKHTKRGRFCSRSCSDEANRNRKWTPEQKKAVADGLREWHATSETAEVAAHNFTSKRINGEPEPIAPITKPPLKSNQFVQDGDLWEET